jgi:hypothetical protein
VLSAGSFDAPRPNPRKQPTGRRGPALLAGAVLGQAVEALSRAAGSRSSVADARIVRRTRTSIEVRVKRLTAVLFTVVCATSPRLHAQTGDSAGAAVAAAQAAATSWLGLIDRAQLGMSWDSAATAFRSAIARPAWITAAHTARSPFDPLGARTLVSASYQTQLPSAPPGEYVVLQYRTKARGGRTVVETVTPMKEPGGRWRVSGYYIRPQ